MLLAGKNVISEFESKKAKILEDIELKVQENIKMIKKEQEILRESIERKELKSDHIKILLEGELFTKKKIMKYKTQGIREQVLQYITSNFETEGTVTEHSLREFFYHSLTTEEVRIVLKHISIPEKKIEEKFDDIWRNLTSQIPRKVSRNADKVARDTENALVSFITLHGYETKLRNKLCQMPLENWKDKQLTQPVEDKHFTVDYGSYWGKGKHFVGKHFTHNFQLKAIQIGNAALYEAKEHATLISKKKDDFTSTFVLQLLDKLDKSLQEHCSEVSDYKISFKHDYKLEICLIACSCAIPVFEKMVDAFHKQHDPLENINYKKNTLYTKFKNQHKQTETEEAIADNVCAHLERPIKEQVRKGLGTIMVKKMRVSKHYLSEKQALKVQILLDLYKNDNYESFMLYVKDIRTCLIKYLQHYTIEFCDQKVKESEKTELRLAAEEEIIRLTGVIKNVISQVSEYASISEWLGAFCKDESLSKELGIKLEADDLLDEYQSVKGLNMENLKKTIFVQLHCLEQRVVKSMDQMRCKSEMGYWKNSPHEIFFKQFIGCTAQCPFCGEQCDLAKDHVKVQPHRTEVHQINCLAGWRETTSKVMTTGFCPERVASDRSFKRVNGKPHPYKNYRSVYPDWSIPPNPTSKSTLYWKWFISKYRIELAEEFNAKPADVPAQWSTYTWEVIKDDLLTVYNIDL